MVCIKAANGIYEGGQLCVLRRPIVYMKVANGVVEGGQWCI